MSADRRLVNVSNLGRRLSALLTISALGFGLLATQAGHDDRQPGSTVTDLNQYAAGA